MKPRSAKQKGKRLEYKVASMIRGKGLDKDCQRMPLSGAWAHLPQDIYTHLPLHIECKCQERMSFWSWWNILCSKARHPQRPVLVVSANRRPIVACIEIEYLLDLLKIEQDYMIEIRDQDNG